MASDPAGIHRLAQALPWGLFLANPKGWDLRKNFFFEAARSQWLRTPRELSAWAKRSLWDRF